MFWTSADLPANIAQAEVPAIRDPISRVPGTMRVLVLIIYTSIDVMVPQLKYNNNHNPKPKSLHPKP